MDAGKERLAAAITYIPVLGWLYAYLTSGRNAYVMFHVRQSIGLFLYLIVIFAGWGVLTWALSWIPWGFLIGVVLFTLVIVAAAAGVVAWIVGIINALRGRVALLPIFGAAAHRLRI